MSKNINDNVLICELIHEQKQIKILATDSIIEIKIKKLINELIFNDILTTRTFNGKPYITHSAWFNKDKTLNKINQIRFKHWFFSKII